MVLLTYGCDSFPLRFRRNNLDSYPYYAAALCSALGSTPDVVEARLRKGENVVTLSAARWTI